jgi:hypothetical protein
MDSTTKDEQSKLERALWKAYFPTHWQGIERTFLHPPGPFTAEQLKELQASLPPLVTSPSGEAIRDAQPVQYDGKTWLPKSILAFSAGALAFLAACTGGSTTPIPQERTLLLRQDNLVQLLETTPTPGIPNPYMNLQFINPVQRQIDTQPPQTVDVTANITYRIQTSNTFGDWTSPPELRNVSSGDLRQVLVQLPGYRPGQPVTMEVLLTGNFDGDLQEDRVEFRQIFSQEQLRNSVIFLPPTVTPVASSTSTPTAEPVYDVGFTNLYVSDSSGNPRSSFVVGEPVVVNAGTHIGNTTPPDGWASGVVELVSSLGTSAVGQPFDPKGGFASVTLSGLAPGSYSLVGKMSTDTADTNPDDNYVPGESFVINAPPTPTGTATATPVPSPTGTHTPTPSPISSPPRVPTPPPPETPTPVPPPEDTPTPVPPDPTPTPTATPLPTATPTPRPTATPVPTATAAPIDYNAIANEIQRLVNAGTNITSYDQIKHLYEPLLALSPIKIDHGLARAIEPCEVFDPAYSAFISNIGTCTRPNDRELAYSSNSRGIRVRSAPLDVILMGLIREDVISQAVKDNTTAPPSSELQLYLESAGNIGFVIGDQILKGLGLDLYNIRDTEENRQLMGMRAANATRDDLFVRSAVAFRLQGERLGYFSVSNPHDKLTLNEAAGMYLDLVGQQDPNGYLEGLLASSDLRAAGDRIAQTSLTSFTTNADPVRSDRYLRNWSNSFILQSEG